MGSAWFNELRVSFYLPFLELKRTFDVLKANVSIIRALPKIGKVERVKSSVFQVRGIKLCEHTIFSLSMGNETMNGSRCKYVEASHFVDMDSQA